MEENNEKYLVWLDLEFTNEQNLAHSRIMQVGMLITSEDLHPLWPTGKNDGISTYVTFPKGDELLASKWVRDKQAKTMDHAQLKGKWIGDAEDELCDYLIKHCPAVNKGNNKNKPTLAGKTVHMDYYHLLTYMENFSNLINFRLFDVRTLKDAAKNWSPGFKCPHDVYEEDPDTGEYPREYYDAVADMLPQHCGYPDAIALEKQGGKHDALFDVYEAIATANCIRDKIF